MDINNIFGLFSSGSKEEEIYENLDTFKKTPLFKLSMFVKLILNGVNFKKKLLYFFQKSSEDLGLDDVDLAVLERLFELTDGFKIKDGINIEIAIKILDEIISKNFKLKAIFLCKFKNLIYKCMFTLCN